MEKHALTPQGAATPARGWRRVRRFVALPLAALVLSGCTVPNFGASKGATSSSASVFHLWQGFSLAAAVIGGFTLLLILWAVIRYRRKSPDAIPAQTQYHLPLEIIYTVVPILIVFALFAATMVVENKEVANPAAPVTVNVNAFQWGWKFSYPGSDVVVVGQTTQNPVMVIPVDTNIHVSLTSTDVIHGFYVHDFNFSRYALPGVDNTFTLHPVKTGTFFGQCTQLCGLYHSLMYFKVKVVSQADYTAWVAANRNPATYAAAVAITNQQLSTHAATKYTGTSGEH